MIAYKFRSGRGTKDSDGKDVFVRDIELMAHDTIYVPTVEQLNDPAEALVDDGVFQWELRVLKPMVPKESYDRVKECLDSLFDKIHNAGIYSLSKRIDNELMWAYYASGHSGYAIIIDTDVLANSFGHGKWGGMHEIDVHYSAKLPRFEIDKIGKQKFEDTLSCLVGTKSMAWEHEAEHRLVFDNGGRCLKIDYRAVKGFVFGYRMAAEDIDFVMKEFAGRDLEYYRMTIKDRSYKLLPQRLNDKYPVTKKYSPNNVEYDVEELLEGDKGIGGVGYKYRSFVEQALKEVSREPFVKGISHIIVDDDQKYPHILIWTSIKQDGSVRRMRSFEYDLIEGALCQKAENQGESR